MENGINSLLLDSKYLPHTILGIESFLSILISVLIYVNDTHGKHEKYIKSSLPSNW